MKIKGIVAIVIAGMVAMQMPMVALAAEKIESTITSSITKDAYVDVKNMDGIDVSTSGTNIDLTIGGNGNVHVTADESYDSELNGICVNAPCNITVKDISVENLATNPTNGIRIDDSTFGEEDTVSISAGSISASGNLSTGICDKNTGVTHTILVEGDIDSDDEGIFIQTDINKSTSPDITIICTGTISADTPLSLFQYSTGVILDFTLYGLLSTNGGPLLLVNSESSSDDVNSIYDGIDYIIKTGQNDSMINYSGTTEKTIQIGGNNLSFDTAQEGTKITVKVADGYDLNAGNGIIVSKDDNGNYVVQVPRGGGVTLEAILKEIEKKYGSSGGASWTSTPTTVGSLSSPIDNGKWTFENGVYKYTVNGEPLKNTIACIKYIDANGKEVIGFYYFDTSGKMQTEWQKIGDKYYYFDKATGAMLMNTTTPDGYKVGPDGAYIAE